MKLCFVLASVAQQEYPHRKRGYFYIITRSFKGKLEGIYARAENKKRILIFALHIKKCYKSLKEDDK
jgi:hypothetical protein